LGFGAVIGADNAAHVGGLAAGGLFGLIYRKRHAPSVERSTLPSAIAVISVMLAFGATIRARGHAETAASLVNRGVDLARADDHDAAIAAYRRALVLEPNDAIAHYDLGLSLEEIGDYAGGIEHLTRAYEIAPSTERRDALVSAHLHRAHALFESGDKSGAIDGYRKAVSVDPNNARAHSELGLALLGNDELDAAISELRAALKIQPDVDTTKGALASALTKQGLALAKQGKRAEAIAHFREAITLDDESWESHYGLGLALVEERDPSGAVSELQKAFELEPSETVRTALADAIEARGDARADAGALGAALDDMGSATVLRLAPLDAGTPPRSPR
jgi:superkiller protein 3